MIVLDNPTLMFRLFQIARKKAAAVFGRGNTTPPYFMTFQVDGETRTVSFSEEVYYTPSNHELEITIIIEGFLHIMVTYKVVDSFIMSGEYIRTKTVFKNLSDDEIDHYFMIIMMVSERPVR